MIMYCIAVSYLMKKNYLKSAVKNKIYKLILTDPRPKALLNSEATYFLPVIQQLLHTCIFSWIITKKHSTQIDYLGEKKYWK